jgi:signal transduction histidine kinase
MKRMADRIAGAALRAAGLVKQILGFSRKDMGDIRKVDIGDVAKEALVLADPGRISQVVMNLCVNARDAIGIRPGAIEIAVRCPAFDHGPPAGPAASAPAGVSSIAMMTSSDGRTHLMHVGSMAPDRP